MMLTIDKEIEACTMRYSEAPPHPPPLDPPLLATHSNCILSTCLLVFALVLLCVCVCEGGRDRL